MAGSTLTLVERMSDEEDRLRRALKRANLVIETDFTAVRVRESQRAYGAAVRGMTARGYTYPR